MSYCFVFRVALVGSSGVGKSTFAYLVSEATTANPKRRPPIKGRPPATTGVELYAVSVVVKVPGSSVLNRVQLYDTPGGEGGEGLAQGLLTGATLPQAVDGCLIMCDPESSASVETARRWVAFVQSQPHQIDVFVGVISTLDQRDSWPKFDCGTCAVAPHNHHSATAAMESVVAPIHHRTEMLRLAQVSKTTTSCRPISAKDTFPSHVSHDITPPDFDRTPDYQMTLVILGSCGAGKSTLLSAVADNCAFPDYIPSTRPELATFDVTLRPTNRPRGPYCVRVAMWELMDYASAMPITTAGVFLLIDERDEKSFAWAKQYIDTHDATTRPSPHCILIVDKTKEQSSPHDDSFPHMLQCRAWALTLRGFVLETDITDVASCNARNTFSAFLNHVVTENERAVSAMKSLMDDASVHASSSPIDSEFGRRVLYDALDPDGTGSVPRAAVVRAYDSIDPFREGMGARVVAYMMARHRFADRDGVPFDVFCAILCRLVTM